MSKLMSTNYTTGAFNLGTLLLRIGFGGLILPHGYDKLVNFATYKVKFLNFLGLGQSLSLSLAIFAEFFCALLLVIGLFSRLATIPLIILCSVALFQVHRGLIFGEGEHAALYLVAFIALLIVGPGKISVDGMAGK